jgi:hypothetical protein
MADQIVFDKLTYLDRLVRAGIAEDHARAHTEALNDALRESVATKADIDALRIATKADIDALRVATKADIGAVRTELELAVRDMTIRTGTMLIALFGALTAIKFFS